MRRLYLQIYLAFVGILLLFGVVIALAWWLMPAEGQDHRAIEGIAALIGEVLPAPDRPVQELQRKIDQLAEQFSTDISVRGATGTLLASAGDPLPAPREDRTSSGWLREAGGPPIVALHMPDGRWTLARWKHHRKGAGLGLPAALLLLAGVIAIGAYPLARRITGRLERLKTRVDALGAGHLDARVQVEGCDEVADLARSFNRAADRIDRLLRAQRTVLASASHELRSPLTRMRMAVELLAGHARSELRDQVAKDIAELDALIGELLLASKLDTLDQPIDLEEVDLLALLAEESSRTGAQASGEAVVVRGDARMLRRLIRNLLENARRYSGGAAVRGSVAHMSSGAARLTIEDDGPGVAESERERIFAPFYRPPGASEADGGVGLGLALVRQIAQHHRGEVRYVARAEGGSRFEVDIPA
ncbi:MAG: ATP-binding protein [Betaproteobacteria bacterium]